MHRTIAVVGIVEKTYIEALLNQAMSASALILLTVSKLAQCLLSEAYGQSNGGSDC